MLALIDIELAALKNPYAKFTVQTKNRDQVADRAYRIGQDKPVFVYNLVTENTVEEKILAMQERKKALADGVYEGGKKNRNLKFHGGGFIGFVSAVVGKVSGKITRRDQVSMAANEN